MGTRLSLAEEEIVTLRARLDADETSGQGEAGSGEGAASEEAGAESGTEASPNEEVSATITRRNRYRRL